MARSAGALRDHLRATLFKAEVLDRVEQIVVFLFFALLCERVFASGNPFAPITLISEASIAFCTLIRRPTTDISYRPLDWLLATLGTIGSLLVVPVHDSPHAFIIPGVILVAAGNAFQLSAKLVIRRSFGVAPANRGVKDAGPYRIVRHPMYAGYFVANIGVLMLMPSWFNLMVYLAAWTSQVFRLQAEERLLSKDPAYRAFQKRIPYRVLPGVF